MCVCIEVNVPVSREASVLSGCERDADADADATHALSNADAVKKCMIENRSPYHNRCREQKKKTRAFAKRECCQEFCRATNYVF